MEPKELDLEKVEKAKEIISELEVDFTERDLIQDNKKPFIIDGKSYRCRMPSQLELNQANQAKKKKYMQLLQDSDTLSKKKLKKLIKEKFDVDIDQLELELNEVRNELQKLYLNTALKDDNDESLKEDEKKAEEIKLKFINLHATIGEYLEPCLEEQLRKYHREYLAYLCTEKHIKNDKWEQVWKSFEDFEKENGKLVYKALDSLETLLLNIYE